MGTVAALQQSSQTREFTQPYTARYLRVATVVHRWDTGTPGHRRSIINIKRRWAAKAGHSYKESKLKKESREITNASR